MDNNKKENIDRFALLASGGKKMTGEVPRLEEISPRENEIKLLDPTEKTDINIIEFNENKEYFDFLIEKDRLKNYYMPFFKNYAERKKINNERYISDFFYRKETLEDKHDFYSVLNGAGEWEKITLPHYVGPDGKWNAFYRTNLTLTRKLKSKQYIIEFEAVDYIAEIYLNGRMVDRHVGFFSPFSIDVTEYIKKGKNSLLVVVKNDITSTGVTINGFTHYGNKIYGATHFGYDEPNLGWHHCPAGTGIYGKVKFIECNKQRITDIFVMPDIDTGKITVNSTINNYLYDKAKLKISYIIEGRNFREKTLETGKIELDYLQNGENYIKKILDIPNFKLWTQNEPFLYEVTVFLYDEKERVVDINQIHFGMRKFHMDENSTPKGAFYFNNERIMLRGTNEMGHLPKSVMKGDYEQLIDDIMIAKVANLNYYRMTQRPVLNDVYTYFDMTGMLCQSDFPLFSYLKYGALGDALKQVDEMEKHTRNHPSVILETFCNETLDKTAWGKEQYNMSRFEMEKFFNASKEIVEISNPQRVIKYCEGDYAPLSDSKGISDFHCYTYWYVSHGLPAGKLRKGYLPPIRKEWMTGCGEYGVDGLDRFDLMKKYCPKDWLPETQTENWSPKKIAKEQCFILHGDFFPEQNNAEEWIRVSREWQRYAIKQYVHSLRLRSDYIESTAVHLLIDAWPCGWTKTLVDVERIPKPAYYAFKEANIPLRVSLRRDKYTVYENDTVSTEVYAFNDLPKEYMLNCILSVYLNNKLEESYITKFTANASSTTYLGQVDYTIPKGFIGKITVKSKMTSELGETFDEVNYTVKNKLKKANKKPLILSEKLYCVNNVCSGNVDKNIIFLDREYYVNNQNYIETEIKNGKRAVVFIDKPLNVFGEDIIFRTHTLEEEVRANNWVARSKKCNLTKEFDEMDFMNFYNKDKDYQDLTAWFKFDWKNSEEILYTFEDSDEQKYNLHKKHKMIMARKKVDKGEIILTTLSALKGCIGYNPVLDKLIVNLIEK